MPTPVAKVTLDSLDPSHIELGLDRMVLLMERLGNPHLDFKSIHIAGTNGKGSTAAMIDSILRAGGYRTGLYTSPHLERFSERIKAGGEEIADEMLDELSSEVKEAAGRPPIIEATYFEFTSAVAFLYFARAGLDVAVIETGLGGRLDATNVVLPLVSVITPVALDHSEYLGDTLQSVAMEKGGIIKASVSVVIGRQPAEVNSVLEKISAGRKSMTVCFSRDYGLVSRPGRMLDFRDPHFELDRLELSLEGRHQHDNAAVALAVAGQLCERGLPVSESAIRRGLASVFWPGRFEIISASPDIILDGAHNPDGARALAEAVYSRYMGKKGIVIAGFMADKDIGGMLERLAPLADVLILVSPGGERGFDPQAKIGYKDSLKKETGLIVSPDMESALSEGRALVGNRPFILLTGSLSLIGQARRQLMPVACKSGHRGSRPW